MIHYQLRCSGTHGFDGWFKDSATFKKQAKLGLIECPECGDTQIERALMAPALARREALPVEPPDRPAADAVASPEKAAGGRVMKPGRCIAAKASIAAFTAKPPRNRRKAWRMRGLKLPASRGCRAPTAERRPATPAPRSAPGIGRFGQRSSGVHAPEHLHRRQPPLPFS
jgi:hypothetical protein